MNAKIRGFTLEELYQIDAQLLLALTREKAHSSVEVPLYRAIYAGKKLPTKFGEQLRVLLDICKARKIPVEREDLRWCQALLDMASQVQKGAMPDLTNQRAIFSEEQQQTISTLIHSRCSVRTWLDKSVPENLLKQVMEAGLWAPQSDNLQVIRFIVLQGEEAKRLHQLKHSMGSPVCIIVAQDMRLYKIYKAQIPDFNRFLDCGAAVENMLLTAHSFGLGAVWLTFEKGEAEKLHQKLDLPEHISLTTYIALGWPRQIKLPTGRIQVEEAQIYPKPDSNHKQEGE